MGYQNRVYQFVVEGPLPIKGRVRGRGGVYYTPKATVEGEERVRQAFRDHYPHDPRSVHRFSVEIKVYTDRTDFDGDNVEKAVLDALSKVLWENDRQVKQMFWVILPALSPDYGGECIQIKALEVA